MAENNPGDSTEPGGGAVDDRLGGSGGGNGGIPLDDNQAGAYIDAYNKGRNLPKDPGQEAEDGTYYGIHPPSKPAPKAVAPPPPPPPTVPTKPIHVNTPAQNAALHRHTPGDD